MPVQSLNQKDPLEEGMATHSSILAWRVPWTEGAWYRVTKGLTQLKRLSMYTHTYGEDWVPWWLSREESACQCRRLGFDPWVGKIPWIRKWPLTPVFLLEESQEQGSLEDNSPWGHKETDTITKHVSSQKKPRDLPTQFGSSLESLLSHRLSTF